MREKRKCGYEIVALTLKDMKANESESPLIKNLQQVAQLLQAKPELAKVPEALQEIVMNAWRGDAYYRPPAENVSLFTSALLRLDAIMENVRPEWCGKSF